MTYDREYYEAHKEQIRANRQRYTDSPKGVATRRAYYAANRDRYIAKGRAYYQEHRDEILAWERENRASRSATHRERGLRQYGLTPEQYEAMLAAQGGVCAICGQPETARNRSGQLRALSVDHDHGTGRIRGLLCASCNRGIGYLGDDLATLAAAMKYLEAA